MSRVRSLCVTRGIVSVTC